ncbi:DnaB-like helicase C-terminal domain-containing protein [Deinococcus malanensis]|uniref:DnaB-like helicase C-terminal domain-containing protein n=1 Tax=Deinococcus malanensis TaxID=1706855 RepID=UPI00363388E4
MQRWPTSSPLPNAITTGYADLDDQILGFEPGAMYVLAARPAMGKTAMGYSFALTTAKSGRHVGVASLEMPAKALALRALATAASVDLNRIRQRTTNGPDRERLRMHASRTRGLPSPTWKPPIRLARASRGTPASCVRPGSWTCC